MLNITINTSTNLIIPCLNKSIIDLTKLKYSQI